MSRQFRNAASPARLPRLPRRRALALLALAAWTAGAPAPVRAAEPLPEPAGPVLLTVSGAIDMPGGVARFDRAMLEALGMTRFRTRTNWTRGAVEFGGPSLHALLARLGVREGSLRATALNEYAITLPVSDAVQGGPILAIERDGVPMGVRDKGPVWIVYPYDSDPKYRSEEVFARSIWQLDRLAVER